MNIIQVSNTPKPVGHYSQAIISNGFLFTSGILPIKINNSEKLSIETTIEEQMALVFENLRQLLNEVNLSPHKVIKTTIYISDEKYWSIVNQLYAEFFGEHRPARSIIPVSNLHFGYKIEVEAIAEM